MSFVFQKSTYENNIFQGAEATAKKASSGNTFASDMAVD